MPKSKFKGDCEELKGVVLDSKTGQTRNFDEAVKRIANHVQARHSNMGTEAAHSIEFMELTTLDRTHVCALNQISEWKPQPK